MFSFRACRGENISLIIRFTHPQRALDDIEINTHANETLASLNRTILRRIKGMIKFIVPKTDHLYELN